MAFLTIYICYNGVTKEAIYRTFSRLSCKLYIILYHKTLSITL